MKKTTAILSAAMLLIALFAGCSGTAGNGDDVKEDSGDNAGTNSSAVPASTSDTVETEEPSINYAVGNYETDAEGWPLSYYDYTTPICKTDETLTMWCHCFTPEYLGENGYQDIDFHQEEERLTGVHIEFILSDWNERKSQFSVLQASDNMPDLVSQAGLFITGSKMANIAEGYFANIYDYKDYAPNYLYAIKSLSEKDANVKDATFISPDTIFEFLSLYDEGLPSLAIVGIRNDWIKELGKSINDIVTTDDLHEVLYAFKSQFGCDYPWWMNDSIDNGGWFACYDVKTTLDNVYAVYYPGAIVVDGKVQFYYSNDNARSFVTMINQWISEGLVDPNWMNPSGPSSDLLATEDLGTFPSVAASLSYLKSQTPDSDADWQFLRRTLLYDGQVLHIGHDRHCYSTYNAGTSISATCENIPLAVTWCDWRYSPEGSFLGSYGVEGTMWEYDDSGLPVATDWAYNNPDGLNYTWLTIIYAMNFQSEHGLKLVDSQYCTPGGRDLLKLNYDYYATYEADNAYEWPLGATLDDERSAELASVSGDLPTYIQENILKFCTGDLPLSEWDNYIENLKSLGLDKAIEIYQAIYDEYMEKNT